MIRIKSVGIFKNKSSDSLLDISMFCLTNPWIKKIEIFQRGCSCDANEYYNNNKPIILGDESREIFSYFITQSVEICLNKNPDFTDTAQFYLITNN